MLLEMSYVISCFLFLEEYFEKQSSNRFVKLNKYFLKDFENNFLFVGSVSKNLLRSKLTKLNMQVTTGPVFLQEV